MDSLPFLCQPKSEGIQPCPGSALALGHVVISLQFCGLASQSHHMPFFSFHCGAWKYLQFQSQSERIWTRAAFPGMALPAQIWRVFIRFHPFGAIMPGPGEFAFSQALKTPQHDLAIFSIVCHPIILASKAQMGILSCL